MYAMASQKGGETVSPALRGVVFLFNARETMTRKMNRSRARGSVQLEDAAEHTPFGILYTMLSVSSRMDDCPHL